MKHRAHDMLRAGTDGRLRATRDGEARVALERILDDVAQRIADDGTRTQLRVLAALSVSTRAVSPGAAAALVDRDGSEIARLRAFGVVSTVVVHVLDPRAQRLLLDQLLGADLALAG